MSNGFPLPMASFADHGVFFLQWHTILAQIRPSSATDVSVKFFMDGKEMATQYGRGYIGAAMFLVCPSPIQMHSLILVDVC